jgi:hypothetical protein
MSTEDDRTFAVAATVAGWIAEAGGRSAVIGAVALAVHGYVRATRDLDLATEVEPFTQLRELGERAKREGWAVDVAMPDQEDPLGGVVTIRGSDFDPVQVVNFHNPLRERVHPARAALDAAVELKGAAGLRVVRVEDLVLLKLYAGGRKSRVDVAELLSANPGVDVSELQRRAAELGLEAELCGVIDGD